MRCGRAALSLCCYEMAFPGWGGDKDMSNIWLNDMNNEVWFRVNVRTILLMMETAECRAMTAEQIFAHYRELTGFSLVMGENGVTTELLLSVEGIEATRLNDGTPAYQLRRSPPKSVNLFVDSKKFQSQTSPILGEKTSKFVPVRFGASRLSLVVAGVLDDRKVKTSEQVKSTISSLFTKNMPEADHDQIKQGNHVLDRRFDKTAEAKAQDDDDSSNIVYSREALSGLNTSVKLRTFDPVAEEDTTDLGIALQRNYSNYWKNRSPPAKANSQKKGSLNKLQEAPASTQLKFAPHGQNIVAPMPLKIGQWEGYLGENKPGVSEKSCNGNAENGPIETEQVLLNDELRGFVRLYSQELTINRECALEDLRSEIVAVTRKLQMMECYGESTERRRQQLEYLRQLKAIYGEHN